MPSVYRFVTIVLPEPFGVSEMLPLLSVDVIELPSMVMLSTLRTSILLVASTIRALLAVSVPGV